MFARAHAIFILILEGLFSGGIKYDAENVEKEIRGLYDAGLTGGYTTWHSGSKLAKYQEQKAAFQIDYLKEYRAKQ